MYTFIELPAFSRLADDYFSKDELAELQRFIAHNPQAGDVVPGTGGVRKLRWQRPGMGKRGGLRLPYYVQDAQGRIWLLTVYTKSAREHRGIDIEPFARTGRPCRNYLNPNCWRATQSAI